MRYMMFAALFALTQGSCTTTPPTSDSVQRDQQERILKEGTAAIGMPAIKNFRERRLVKTVLEMRDQENLSTFTYVWSDVQGRPVFLCHSVGFGIPYATQFTNPQKYDRVVAASGGGYIYLPLPQADPNGLFSPSSADGTWVLCKTPKGEVSPQYIEPRILVTTFELEQPKPTEPKKP